ncbi:MAG: alpha/beta hydrolase [Calothrix sp. MO_167.B42]|nr:alpha/beta hydrolase [Calothrix sp. MO_167.B42]
MSESNKGYYLLSVQPIPPIDDDTDFPAYFVRSTAPNNVEDEVEQVANPKQTINKIADFLSKQKNPEIVIAVHGYNTALGNFATKNQQGKGAKGWYQNIRNHIVKKCPNRSKELVLIGYRWPSEEVNIKLIISGFGSACNSLPKGLKFLSFVAFISFLLGLIFVWWTTVQPSSAFWAIAGTSMMILGTIVVSMVLTLFLLRISAYFRDSYRANNFGVPDLVEFIRQLEKAIPKSSVKIKLSFIGHSMGSFVVTNTVRILSDVFDEKSIGNLRTGPGKEKSPSPEIGHVFSLGRLVLVAPDIPAETIISGRANFLSSSLRRFEETYLFSNEGDMILKLASTAANYASFPARTREGGYRLGNVVVQSPKSRTSGENTRLHHGIVNLGEDGRLLDVQGIDPGLDAKNLESADTSFKLSSFLKSLYILGNTSLFNRQAKRMKIEMETEPERPIAEQFTVFDCTDYQEWDPIHQKKVGVLSRALHKRSLNFCDYLHLTYDTFTGKIDTHYGYFSSSNPGNSHLPEACFSKKLIYDLACLGFKSFLEFHYSLCQNTSEAFEDQHKRVKALQKFSQDCQDHGVEVLLSQRRYDHDIMGIKRE